VTTKPFTISLGPDDPDWPRGLSSRDEEWTYEIGARMIRNVTVPSLTAYLPDPTTSSRAAVVVAPGGGFFQLSWEHEGCALGELLRARGIAAFILKYRLLDTGATLADHARFVSELLPESNEGEADRSYQKALKLAGVVERATDDARQAMHAVRRGAERWGIDNAKIGVLGFSAGARLATGIALEERPDTRPDFIAAIYGGRPGPLLTAHGLRALTSLGAASPRAFLVVAGDDAPTAVESALSLHAAWRAAGAQAELHIYAKGGHGFGTFRRASPLTAGSSCLITGSAKVVDNDQPCRFGTFG
jgi:acetyl esterase/lipase